MRPLHELLQSFAAEKQVKVGDIFPALRLCVTGKAQGADLFRSLELLGKACVLSRLDRAIVRAARDRRLHAGLSLLTQWQDDETT